ncbi:hypothetical protein EVAR_5388_1 [Eumeta japonica]|uniref:Uncharacterized protein n=1 Tax=Eumeta variegata TaxID=151549 RepID=A0A4C1TP02_EUMVA|nr:hypothetical protein EVAR_5388_1 [Eumeta japonica]
MVDGCTRAGRTRVGETSADWPSCHGSIALTHGPGWSPPPMFTRSPREIISASLVSWLGMEYLMEERVKLIAGEWIDEEGSELMEKQWGWQKHDGPTGILNH